MNLEKALDNLIEEKRYDKRLVPFIKAFFLYNIEYNFWDEETVKNKLQVYKNRIDGIQFIDLEGKYFLTDPESKLILFNSSITSEQIDKDSARMISESFEEQEVITQEGNIKYYKDELLYQIEKLKYSTNIEDKRSILAMITNTFNREPKEFYDIRDVLEKDIINTKGDKETNEYLNECRSMFLPGIANSISDILNTKSPIEKKEAYIRLYAISLVTLKCRLENSKEDKSLIKTQFKALQEEFLDKVDEYAIMAEELHECKIDNSWNISIEKTLEEIQEKLKDVKRAKDIKETLNINDFSNISKQLIDDMKKSYSINTRLPSESRVNQEAEKLADKYDQRFKPIIEEYIKRSAKVYNWNEDELDKKITNYLNGVEKVKFVKDIPNHGISTMGVYNSSERTIYVKDDLSFIKNLVALGVFFHEQEHLIARTKRNYHEFESELEYNNINEYATEIGTVHLLGDKIYEDELCFTHTMDGYDEFKFAGSMISAALGISEFDFAKLRNKGSNVAIKTLKEKFSYLNIEGVLEKFDKILEQIINSPSIIYMQGKSEAYAKLYNMSKEIMNIRITYEKSKLTTEEEKKKFDLKSKYERTKIAHNMKLAKRKLNLKNKYIKPIIGKNDTIYRDSKVTKQDKKQYLSLIEELYPEKNIQFDNKQIVQYLNREFKHPTIGKISRFLKRNKVPKLIKGQAIENIDSNEEARKEFKTRYKIQCIPQSEKSQNEEERENRENQRREREEI